MNSRSLDAAWWAVIARFLVHGLVVSTWLSRIPAIQSLLHLKNGVLGLCLLGSAVGSLGSIPLCGRMVTRYGSSRVTTWTSVAFCLTLIFPGLAFNAFTLFLALTAYGAAAGANDVAMNAQGVAVENVLGHPTMSRFHAMFSIGGMIGAGLGGLVAAHHIQPLPHLFGGSLIFLAITLSAASLTSEFEEQHAGGAHRLPFRAIPPVLLALCAIGFCAFLSEGAMADWIAVYLKQVLEAGQGLAAIGYAVFSVGMATFRLLGDAITARLGPARTVRTAALVAMFGLIFALSMPSPYWALPGFAAAGAGFSVIIPLVFAAGGRVPKVSRGAGIATVSGIGYLAFLFGPPSIGFLSQLTNLRYALFLVVLLMFISAWLSRVMERLGRQEG
ncbi:MAG TPA: MFS transporter [Bryobacteraceae bacterium]